MLGKLKADSRERKSERAKGKKEGNLKRREKREKINTKERSKGERRGKSGARQGEGVAAASCIQRLLQCNARGPGTREGGRAVSPCYRIDVAKAVLYRTYVVCMTCVTREEGRERLPVLGAMYLVPVYFSSSTL